MTGYDLPAWLLAKVEQRLALLEDAGSEILELAADGSLNTIIMMALTEPTPGQSQTQWDRSCDCCGKFCPDDTEFYTGHVRYLVDGVLVAFTMGVCPAHKF